MKELILPVYLALINPWKIWSLEILRPLKYRWLKLCPHPLWWIVCRQSGHLRLYWRMKISPKRKKSNYKRLTSKWKDRKKMRQWVTAKIIRDKCLPIQNNVIHSKLWDKNVIISKIFNQNTKNVPSTTSPCRSDPIKSISSRIYLENWTRMEVAVSVY